MKRNTNLLSAIHGSLVKAGATDVTYLGNGVRANRDLQGSQPVVLGQTTPAGQSSYMRAFGNRPDVQSAMESLRARRELNRGTAFSPGYASRITEAGRSPESQKAMSSGTARQYGVSPETQAQVRQYGQYGVSPDMQRKFMRNPGLLSQFDKMTDISGTDTGKRLAAVRAQRAPTASEPAAARSSAQAGTAAASPQAQVSATPVTGTKAPASVADRMSGMQSANTAPAAQSQQPAPGEANLTPYEQYQKGMISYRDFDRMTRKPSNASNAVTPLQNQGNWTVAQMQSMAPGQPAAAYANATDYADWSRKQQSQAVAAGPQASPRTPAAPVSSSQSPAPRTPTDRANTVQPNGNVGNSNNAALDGGRGAGIAFNRLAATPSAPQASGGSSGGPAGKPLLNRSQPQTVSPVNPINAADAMKGNGGVMPSSSAGWKPAGSGNTVAKSVNGSPNANPPLPKPRNFDTNVKNMLAGGSNLSYGKVAELLRKSAGFVRPGTDTYKAFRNTEPTAYAGPEVTGEPNKPGANPWYYQRPETRDRLASQQRRELEREWYAGQKRYVARKSDDEIAKEVEGYKPLADRKYGWVLDSFGASKPEAADYIHDSINTMEMGANGMQKGLDWALSKGVKWLDPRSWGSSTSARMNRMAHDTAWGNAARVYDARHEKLLGSLINADPNDKRTRRLYQLAKANGEFAGGEIATAGLGKVLKGVGAGARLVGRTVGHVPGNVVASRISRGLSGAESADLYRAYVDRVGRLAGRHSVPSQLRSFDAFKKAYGWGMVFGNDAVRSRWAALAGHGADFKPGLGTRIAGATGHLGEAFGSAVGSPARYVGTALTGAANAPAHTVGAVASAVRHPVQATRAAIGGAQAAGRGVATAIRHHPLRTIGSGIGKGLDAEWRLHNAYDVARGAYTGNHGDAAGSAGNLAWYDVMSRSRNPWVRWGLGMGVPVAAGMALGGSDDYTE